MLVVFGLLLVVAVSLVAGAGIHATWFDTEDAESQVGLRKHLTGDPLHHRGPPGFGPPRRPPHHRGPPGFSPPRRPPLPPLPGGGGLRPPKMTGEDVEALVVTYVLITVAGNPDMVGSKLCLTDGTGGAPLVDSVRYLNRGTWIVKSGECAFTVDDRTGKVSP